MKKFRRWLIHKLGGLCKDEVKPNITLTEKEREIRKIKAVFRTTFKEMPKEEIKRILLDGI